VRDENIDHIVVEAEEVALSIFREQLPKHLAEKIVDELTLERDADDTGLLTRTLAALRARDAESDAEKVEELMDAWQSGGLGVAGPEATLSALQLGQVAGAGRCGSRDDAPARVDRVAEASGPRERHTMAGFEGGGAPGQGGGASAGQRPQEEAFTHRSPKGEGGRGKTGRWFALTRARLTSADELRSPRS